MTHTTPLLLLVEDEPSMCKFLQTTLGSRGYRIEEASTGARALEQAGIQPPHVVLLDLGLPDMDGLEVVRRLRLWTDLPIIVVSARGSEQDKLLAFEAGANDYITKPFGVPELAARLQVALRTHSLDARPHVETMRTVGELQLDLAGRRVLVSGREVPLTPTEFSLFTTLMKHAGRVLTHRQLLQQVWGPSDVDNIQYLRVYMAQLRHKLERDPARPRYLVTVPAIGYRLKVEG